MMMMMMMMMIEVGHSNTREVQCNPNFSEITHNT